MNLPQRITFANLGATLVAMILSPFYVLWEMLPTWAYVAICITAWIALLSFMLLAARSERRGK